jgi:adenylate dimethylallyltransferase
MNIQLTLVWGPTSTGKTAAAVELALATGAPVIALDRCQCYPQIAVGSGRPLPAELKSTRRIYLAERKLSDGILSGAEANILLKQRLAECAASCSQVILEGGSISLLNAMVADPHWESDVFCWSFRRFQLGDADAFLQRARRRVQRMFQRAAGASSLLDELVDGWSDPRNHAALADIDGYRAAIKFANRRQYSLAALRYMAIEEQDMLIDEIAQEYLDHARWQEVTVKPVPMTWKRAPIERIAASG